MKMTKDPEVRWQMVVSRDRSYANDIFVYANKATKIYCRPSCPSRLSRRSNVEFYDTPVDAEQAGFRACKRCKPQLSHDVLSYNNELDGNDFSRDETIDYAQHKLVIRKACQSIILNGRPKRLKELADEAGLTQSHFHRVFKRITGVTPRHYGIMITSMKNVKGNLFIEEHANSSIERIDSNTDISSSTMITSANTAATSTTTTPQSPYRPSIEDTIIFEDLRTFEDFWDSYLTLPNALEFTANEKANLPQGS